MTLVLGIILFDYLTFECKRLNTPQFDLDPLLTTPSMIHAKQTTLA